MDLYTPISVTVAGQLYFFDTKDDAREAFQAVVGHQTDGAGFTRPVYFEATGQGSKSTIVWTPGVPIVFHGSQA